MSLRTSPRRSRIAHFKAPFLFSVAAPAALGMACGGNADDNPDPSLGQTDAEAVCPASAAEVGTSCAGYVRGLTCDYAYCYGSTPTRRCDESTGQWAQIPLPTCNPPQPGPEACQPTLPVPGSDCAMPEQLCLYPGGCEGESSAICRSGQWLVMYSSGPACNPPGVVPVCPEREIVAGEGCAYEGQACSREACELGTESSTGHVCASGQWQEASVPCPPDGDVPDGGR